MHLEYRLQRRMGDPAPAQTVAEMMGLSPANVRQIDSRVRRKLRALAEVDVQYRELSDLAWLAA